jgi:hypothetical protein
MRRLTDEDILRIWEMGYNQHPLDRALTMLLANEPGMTRDKLAAFSIARRDERLLHLREQLFGHMLKAFAQCPQCTEKLEFTMSTADIRALNKNENDPGEKEEPLEIAAEGITMIFRLPDSRDLASAAGCDDVHTARGLIVQRCVQKAAANGKPVNTRQLPREAVTALSDQMAKYQQEAEVLLDLHCPSCSHKWKIVFDIAAFLWTEISAKAMRLLGEIQTLAFAYKWNEADILSLSPLKRQFYLEAVT